MLRMIASSRLPMGKAGIGLGSKPLVFRTPIEPTISEMQRVENQRDVLRGAAKAPRASVTRMVRRWKLDMACIISAVKRAKGPGGIRTGWDAWLRVNENERSTGLYRKPDDRRHIRTRLPTCQ